MKLYRSEEITTQASLACQAILESQFDVGCKKANGTQLLLHSSAFCANLMRVSNA
jgi:hypothetical protein